MIRTLKPITKVIALWAEYKENFLLNTASNQHVNALRSLGEKSITPSII